MILAHAYSNFSFAILQFQYSYYIIWLQQYVFFLPPTTKIFVDGNNDFLLDYAAAAVSIFFRCFINMSF